MANMYFYKGFSLAVLMFFLSYALYSQEEYVDSTYYDEYEYYEEDDTVTERSFIAEFNFSIKNSIGLMKENLDIRPIGLNIGVYKQLNKSIPLYFGAGFYYEKYSYNSMSYIDVSYEDGYEYNYSDNFSAGIIGLDIGAKYFSKKSLWRFNPYVQFDLKLRRAYSIVNTVNIDIDETENSDFGGGNSNIGYGMGIGTIVDVNSDNYFLNISCSYTGGGGLFLYKKNNGGIINYVTDYYDYKYTALSFFMVRLGITFM